MQLELNAGPLYEALKELLSLIEAASDVAHEFSGAFVRFVESGKQIVALKNDLNTTPLAGVAVIGAYPSDGLLGFLAAARAGNFDALAVEQIFGH